jgi:hypothetical protein
LPQRVRGTGKGSNCAVWGRSRRGNRAAKQNRDCQNSFHILLFRYMTPRRSFRPTVQRFCGFR